MLIKMLEIRREFLTVPNSLAEGHLALLLVEVFFTIYPILFFAGFIYSIIRYRLTILQCHHPIFKKLPHRSYSQWEFY